MFMSAAQSSHFGTKGGRKAKSGNALSRSVMSMSEERFVWETKSSMQQETTQDGQSGHTRGITRGPERLFRPVKKCNLS